MPSFEKLIARSLSLLVLLFILVVLSAARQHSYLSFHCLAELFSVVVACGVFALAWNSRQFAQNGYLLWLGIAYLFTAGLDLVHTLSYRGMGFLQRSEANIAAQLWISARYVESVSLLIAPVFIRRKLRPDLAFLSLAAACSVALLSIFVWRIFPTCFLEGPERLTTFKIVSEYVICCILVGAGYFLYRKRSVFDPAVLRLVMMGLGAAVLSELCFTLYRDPYGPANMIGHYFKIVFFYLVYKAVIETGLTRPYDLLFRELKQSEEALRESQQRYQSLVDLCPDAIAVESAGKLLYVNRAGAQLFGASAAHELENHVLVDLISRDSRLTIESLVRLAGECDGPTPLVEMQIDRLDGRTVDIEAAGVRCVLPGKQLGTQLVLRDITDRKDAEVRMRVTNEQLEQRVAERTAEAERRAGQLQALVSQLAQVEQQERRKLAQLLHDHLQQFLVAGKMQVSFILSRARGKDVLQAAEEADRLLKLSIDASRTLTVELCPPILYHSGLAAALAWLVSWKRERYGLKLEVVADQAADPDSESVRTLLFQSVRELLFNVVKHSGVKQARVTMQRTPDSQVRISVEDEGRGFDCARVNAPASGEFGLFSIRQRLELVGGTLTVRSGPGRGTRVDLLAPIHVPSPAPPSAISAEPS